MFPESNKLPDLNEPLDLVLKEIDFSLILLKDFWTKALPKDKKVWTIRIDGLLDRRSAIMKVRDTVLAAA